MKNLTKVILIAVGTYFLTACGDVNDQTGALNINTTEQHIKSCDGVDYHIDLYRYYDESLHVYVYDASGTKTTYWMHGRTALNQDIAFKINDKETVVNFETMCYNIE